MTLLQSLSTLPSLKEVIDMHGLSTRKALGQHFLLDGNITDRITRYAGPLSGFHVIEIGPGPGGLTRSLLKAGANPLYVVEMDERCMAALHELQTAVGDVLHIVPGDALDIDLTALTPAPRKIVANLPYNAGTQMLLNWLEAVYQNPTAFASMTLMFQKEVAERIIAVPRTKDYGRLSVLCQWLCECRYDYELPPGAFSPPPKVTSAVVTLTPRAKPLVAVEKQILELVVGKAFNQRRKMLRGALKGLAVPPEILLEKAGIAPTARAEEIEVKRLCELAACYTQLQAADKLS
ncbi:MAG: 16S rRNA (adenine(1518)-N(6)/adenine(1519)-N(6))-dimethyltransferase RsmA [Rickettsiales bacterium]|nr:16S rRNA (adenine(1518)-N(6)/adenine(1519)-N(6))-dimethyltransferase RsmA [Rickettsiales bacterium]